jgi:hypothetical protein
MAKPRVFISSTYYDLKHVRSSLDLFVESLGFEPVLSEKGDIAYTPDTPLDESCYREASTADIFVLIIGGRYGTEASGKQKMHSHSFYDRYDSITKKEYENAILRDVPVYVLIENNVYSEYQTYLRNKENKNITYAHVDSVNIFQLIEEILSKPRNNPIHTFERFSDIESWLRDQWAGLFRELLQKQSQQQQLTALGVQITELKATNETMRRYLEAVMRGITPDASTKLIKSEQQRLEEIERNERIKTNKFYRFVNRVTGMSFDDFLKATMKADSFIDFEKAINLSTKNDKHAFELRDTLEKNDLAQRDFNEIRKILGLKSLTPSKKKAERQKSNTPDPE